MRRLYFVVVLVVVLLVVIFKGCTTPTPSSAPAPIQEPTTTAKAKPIELNFVTFVPLSTPEYAKQFKPLFIDRVNERAKGELIIIERGGPEVMDRNEIGRAVQQGLMDMTNCPATMFSSLVPGCATNRLSEVVERDVPGCFEYIQSLYADKGIYYLGRTQVKGPDFLYLFFNKAFKNFNDLKGRRVGTAGNEFVPYFKALGMSAMVIPFTEYYPANERGVVDGNASSLSNWFGMGLWEIAPYLLDRPFQRSPGVHIINMKKWNSIPPHLQQLLIDVQLEFEKEFPVVYDKFVADVIKTTTEKKAKLIKLPADEEKWMMETFYNLSWEEDYNKYPKEIISKLEGMIRKTR